MSSIKIFVTHIPNKDDQLVGNPLMVDVIAGADYQTKKIPDHMVLDNTGDNISSKNKEYCELTTQYWAWKNVDADYYGFCHYRRFLALTDNKVSGTQDPSGRGQVYAHILNDISVKKYHLDDENAMRKYIEKYDCILPLKQDLRKLPTPIGKKKSVYDHFAAHDRYFMHASDLDVLVEIIEEIFPEYAKDAHTYLDNPFFWGYNCFVLKKEIFNELCEFEFTVLFELEKRVDTTLYNRQAMRVPGFMGEILSCIFFYHLQNKNNTLKVTETQLIYFEYTDKQTLIKPLEDTVIPIVFYIEPIPPFMFSITIESFIRQHSENHKYDVIIMHRGISKNYLDNYKKQFSRVKNIYVRYYDITNIERTLLEINQKVEDIRLLLPWIFPLYEKILLINWNVIFNGSVNNLLKFNIEKKFAAGVVDALMVGRAFDISPNYEKFLKNKLNISKCENLINTDICLINLKEIRNHFNIKEILSDKLPAQIPSFKEIFNSMFQNGINQLPFCWNYYYTEDLEEKRIINQQPAVLLNKYNNSFDNAVLQTYNPTVMWRLDGSKFNIEYWKLARQTDFYPLFLEHFSVILNQNNVNTSWLLLKINGFFKCIQDHGLLYTCRHAIKKFVCFITKKFR